jgi:ATP-dependent helicase/nuclease subunit B
VLAQTLAEDRRAQFLAGSRREHPQAFVPHTAQDEGQLRTLERDLNTVLDYEAGLLDGFEPRYFEWDFGHKGDLVEYAGAWLNGTVDRIDVDAHGGAVVIDYKHKGANGFAREYAAFPGGDDADGAAPFSPPRRVQALIYAQVVRRRLPNLAIRGAMYLNTRGRDHVLVGALDGDQMERVFGELHKPKKTAAAAMAVERNAGFGSEHAQGMDALLDATEEAIRAAVARMMDGDIEAAPVDARACDHCPVMNCERRLTK